MSASCLEGGKESSLAQTLLMPCQANLKGRNNVAYAQYAQQETKAAAAAANTMN